MNDLIAKRTAKIKHTQLETLVSFMETNPSLSTGKSDKLPLEERKVMWRKLYLQLNAISGGTQKTMEQWKKAWKDQKAKTHGKAMKLIETEGNSTHLTPLEERILKILSQNNEFKSPIPSTDIFLIPETGIVFSLPIVAQGENQPSVSQDVSSTSSVSKNASDTAPVLQKITNPVTSGSNNISESEILPKVESCEEILPTAEPLAGASSLSSKDVPLIDQKVQDKRNSSPGKTPLVAKYSENSPEYARPEFHTDYPSSTTKYSTFKTTSGKGRKRQRSHLRCHYMTADKATETFGYISERNCAVLERIASAMEAQANRAAKQTQLMREIINVVKRK